MKKLSVLFTGFAFVFALLFCCCNVNVVSSYVKLNENGNLTYHSEEILYSNFVKIQGSEVAGSSDYKLNFTNGAFGTPDTSVTIPSFEIGAFEVTRKLYRTILSDEKNVNLNPGSAVKNTPEKDDYLPVNNISWYDAVYFCNRLSAKSGKEPFYSISNIERNASKQIIKATVLESTAKNHQYGYRLPTEAEWEFAARGASPSSDSNSNWMRFFAGKNTTSSKWGEETNSDLDGIGWYYYNCVKGVTDSGADPDGVFLYKVGLNAPVSDELQIYDMSGNVNEWCWDAYNSSGALIIGDSEPEGKIKRALRGGAWCDSPDFCSVVKNSKFAPSQIAFSVGFRIVYNSK